MTLTLNRVIVIAQHENMLMTSKGTQKMTLEKLRKLIQDLPGDMVVLLQLKEGTEDLQTVRVEYHNNGMSHLILTYEE